MSGARDQVSRLLALVPYLQARGAVPLDQVARDFGLTPRQIRSDLKVLWFCGLPGLGMGDLIDVDFDALEGEGVIRLSNADYLRRPLRLDSTEASALMVALRTLRDAAGDTEHEVVDRTLAKIEAAAGEGASMAGQVEIHLSRTEAQTARLQADLEQAVTARRQVRLSYYVAARDEPTERVVDPIAVSTAEGHVYLDAWCHSAEGQRLFRLDRVSAAEVLDTPVVVRDVSPRDLSTGIFRPGPDDVTARLRLAPAARWVAEYYPVEETREAGDGALEVTLRVGDPAWLVRLLLRLGGAATLLEPAGLSENVSAAATKALRNYSGADVGLTGATDPE